jgi:Cu/Ag efflux pump CusA
MFGPPAFTKTFSMTSPAQLALTLVPGFMVRRVRG